MNRGTIILILACLILTAIAFLLLSPDQRGPLYNGKQAGDWLDDFSGNPETSLAAKKAFRQMGILAIPYLVGELTNKSGWHDKYVGLKSKLPKTLFDVTPNSPRIDWQRRKNAAFALGEMGAAADSAISALIEAVNQNEPKAVAMSAGDVGLANQWSPQARATAIQALWKIAPESRQVVEVVMGALQQKYLATNVSGVAITSLAELCPKFKAEIPAIIKSLRFVDTKYWRPLPAHIYAVGQLAPGYAESVPKLIVVLKDLDPRAREAAAYDLGALRRKELSAAKAAIPALLETLQDQDGIVRITVAEAIIKIDQTQSSKTIPALVELLQEQNYTVRLRSVDLLRQMGAGATGALSALEKSLQDEASIVRVWAAEAMEQIRQADTNRASAR